MGVGVFEGLGRFGCGMDGCGLMEGVMLGLGLICGWIIEEIFFLMLV